MKPTLTTILIGLSLCLSAGAQKAYVGISDKSTIPATTIAANVTKYCKNVEITFDEDKAQYLLRVDFTGYGWTDYNLGQPYDAGASLILVDNQGRLVYSKQTNAIHNAFKDMCKDYFGKKGK